MDALLVAVVQAAPSVGVLGVLVTLIVILIRREARVEATHATTLDQQARLHAAELERLNRDHDAELLELQERIRELRREQSELYDHLGRERAARLELPPRRSVDGGRRRDER